MLAQALDRKFTLKKNGEVLVLTDPDPTFPADEVLVFYANVYPELVTATVSPPVLSEDGFLEFNIVSTLGTKG